jgi:hypothetical protein
MALAIETVKPHLMECKFRLDADALGLSGSCAGSVPGFDEHRWCHAGRDDELTCRHKWIQPLCQGWGECDLLTTLELSSATSLRRGPGLLGFPTMGKSMGTSSCSAFAHRLTAETMSSPFPVIVRLELVPEEGLEPSWS